MFNKKPKIAFCFSGQARTLDQTYIFIKKNLFDAAKEQGFDYDVFCAIEDDEDVNKVNLLNPTKVEKIRSSDVEKIINNRYGYFINNKLNSHGSFIHTGVYSVLQQIYKVQKNINMIGNDLYDIVLRLRFDVIFINKLNFNTIQNDVKKGNIICNNQSFKGEGIWKFFSSHIIYSFLRIEDLYFIGDGKKMRIFNRIFDDFMVTIEANHKIYFSHLAKILEISKNKVTKINNKYGKVIIPTTIFNLLQKIIGMQIFVGDSYYYKFLKINHIKLITTSISRILIRKDSKKSWIRLENKTKYEY